ncbi:MAG TPA: glycosylasparaginase, partial [Candidatus Marinimicrobia bacterium]|nr:glycosylasparaginase [Candidatus Neomarinimicrobiota bacterium]
GVKISEADPTIQSVGLGGRPDKDGHVTLDACIMDSQGNAGSVAYLQDIKHPVSVARKVMELTDHVMLVGQGAKSFAITHGFKEENLLTEESRTAWLKWKKKLGKKDDLGPNDDHDTISLLAQDSIGNLAGACTTSGLAYKIPGRVGDSPIIGAGLFVDNEIGAAGATGRGEEVIKVAGSFLIVELMRQGYAPQDACKEALGRTIGRHDGELAFQIAYIALRKDGEIGAAAIRKGFKYALSSGNKNKLHSVKGIIN